MRILIVEDEAELGAVIQRHLEGEGHEVTLVGGGIEALEGARREAFELIVLDLMLPGLDGLEVCSRLRSVGRFTNTAIVILTAEVGNRTRDGARLFGADLFVEKPLLARPFLKQVRDLLEVFSHRTGA